MLEFLEQYISLLIVPAIFGSLLRDIHLVVIQFPLKILQNELFSVVFELKSFVLGLQMLDFIDGIDPVLLDYLIFQKNVSIKSVIFLPELCDLLV